ncbi:hypothetical protein PG989_011759 [Apiospora arundinis]
MSAAFPSVARQVASRRLFSTQMPLRQGHASLGQELQGIFRPSMGVKSQKADWGKMFAKRAQTFGIYATGMTCILGWPWACQWALDGHIH